MHNERADVPPCAYMWIHKCGTPDESSSRRTRGTAAAGLGTKRQEAIGCGERVPSAVDTCLRASKGGSDCGYRASGQCGQGDGSRSRSRDRLNSGSTGRCRR